MITDEFKAVQDALKKLPAHLQQKVVVGATRASAAVMAKEAKENVPERTGLLKKSISVRMVPKRKTPKVSISHSTTIKKQTRVCGVHQRAKQLSTLTAELLPQDTHPKRPTA